VLKSLSESTSSDSIWSLSFWLVLLNIVTTDYHFDLKDHFNPIFSTNILIAEVTVLASRFQSTSTVFCFMLFAIQIHGLFPFFDTWLRSHYTNAHYLLVIIMGLAVDCAIYRMMGPMWLVIWCIIHIGVVVICPVHFIMLQKYKDELQGPWDPAKPIIND
jgi:phosphatidylinositol glycan class C protein